MPTDELLEHHIVDCHIGALPSRFCTAGATWRVHRIEFADPGRRCCFQHLCARQWRSGLPKGTKQPNYAGQRSFTSTTWCHWLWAASDSNDGFRTKPVLHSALSGIGCQSRSDGLSNTCRSTNTNCWSGSGDITNAKSWLPNGLESIHQDGQLRKLWTGCRIRTVRYGPIRRYRSHRDGIFTDAAGDRSELATECVRRPRHFWFDAAIYRWSTRT